MKRLHILLMLFVAFLMLMIAVRISTTNADQAEVTTNLIDDHHEETPAPATLVQEVDFNADKSITPVGDDDYDDIAVTKNSLNIINDDGEPATTGTTNPAI